MKKSLALISTFCGMAVLITSTRVFAQDSTSAAPAKPTATTGKSHNHKKKKVSPEAAPAATPQVTAQATPNPSTVIKATATATTVIPTLFSGNGHLYDRVGEPGDLQKAIAAAARVIGSGSSKHDRAVFLWLGRVTNGSDYTRANSYIRFNLDGVVFAGPKKPSLILTGTIFDQSGSNCKAGDPISLAVDFREIKVDYEGTKLGEVNKGSDIADQVFDILNEHASYQWVLIAQEEVSNAQESMGLPTFVAKAQDGYAFLSNASIR